MNPNWDQPPPVPRQGMSGTTKLILGCGCGCALMAAVLIGVMVVLGYYFQRWFSQSTTQDPVAIREALAQSFEVELPAELAPSGMFRPQPLPWMDAARQVIPSFILFSDAAHDSSLLVMSGSSLPQDPAQWKQQAKQFQDKSGQAEEVQDGKATTEEVKIGEETVKFEFIEGKQKESGKPRISVQGSFRGRNGTVVLIFQGDPQRYDRPTLLKMLRSIRVEPVQAKLDRPDEAQ